MMIQLNLRHFLHDKMMKKLGAIDIWMELSNRDQSTFAHENTVYMYSYGPQDSCENVDMALLLSSIPFQAL